jgi:DNA-binding MarR family transcriptional regulator
MPTSHGSDHDDRETERRIGAAWRELRRGASMAGLRAYLYGDDPDALDLGQVDTLDLLVQRDAWRMRDLACALRVDASTATRAVDRLVAADLAARTRSPQDARAVEVALTPDGRAQHAVLVERRRLAMDRILDGFSEEERRSLAELLERLIAGVDRLIAEEPGPHGPSR